jgi:hypothetical protein
MGVWNCGAHFEKETSIVGFPPPLNMPEGGTPAQRLDWTFRQVLTVPKEAIIEEEAKEKRHRERKRAKKKP